MDELIMMRLFTFTGLEISDDDELSMLENNTYLFVAKGINYSV